jgi:hypothetical protein
VVAGERQKLHDLKIALGKLEELLAQLSLL